METRLNEQPSAAQLLDRALALLRRTPPAVWLRGIAAPVPLVAVLLALYTGEVILRVHAPLPAFALMCSLAYWARFRVLSALARELVVRYAPDLPLAPGARDLLAELKSSMVAGMESCAWLLLPLLGWREPWLLMPVVVPLLALRGALAPSWLARASCAAEDGWATARLAYADTRGARRLFAGVELLRLVGLMVLLGNLYALAVLAGLWASAGLGVEVGLFRALVAADNPVVLLLLLTAALIVMEPLGAAISAVAYCGARVRHEAADLRAAICSLEADASSPRKWSSAGRLVLCIGMAGAPSAHAQPSVTPQAQTRDAQDVQARAAARVVLARPEFEPSDPAALGSWGNLLERLMGPREPLDRDAVAAPRFELPLAPNLLVVSASVACLGVVAWFVRSARRAAATRRRPKRLGNAPRAAPAQPRDHFLEATQLAASGTYDAALRSLYASSVAVLDPSQKRGTSHTRTNGQLLALLAQSEARGTFERLTALFEQRWYGATAVTRSDFEHAHGLAIRLLGELTRETGAHDLRERGA